MALVLDKAEPGAARDTGGSGVGETGAEAAAAAGEEKAAAAEAETAAAAASAAEAREARCSAEQQGPRKTAEQAAALEDMLRLGPLLQTLLSLLGEPSLGIDGDAVKLLQQVFAVFFFFILNFARRAGKGLLPNVALLFLLGLP